MKRHLAFVSILSLSLCATAGAGNFSVSGPGGAIPDCPNSPGAWNLAPTWGVFTSTVNVLNPVDSITKVKLTGLTHTYRGDVHVFLTSPAGVRHNVIVRPGWNGTSGGDDGNYNLGTYDIVPSGGGTVAQGATNINGGTYNQFLNTGGGMWTSGSYVISNTALNSITGPAGTWTLTIVDWWNLDVGSLTGWTLEGTDALDPGMMYWVSSATNRIHRANLDGSSEQNLGTSQTTAGTPISLDVQGGKMYWSSGDFNTIHRANLDGSSEQDLLVGIMVGKGSISLDLPGGKMYWADRGTNTIHRANLDGSSAQDLLVGGLLGGDPISLDLQGGKMYWADYGSNTLRRANLDGSSEQDLLVGVVSGGNQVSLDPSGGKMYWANNTPNTLRRANLDGSTPQSLTGSQSMCIIFAARHTKVSLDVPGGKMYWADSGTSTIHRANLDGSSNQDLLLGPLDNTAPIALDLSGGKLYWADSGTSTIHRANLDGSGEQNLSNPASSTCGGTHIALDVPLQWSWEAFCDPGQAGILPCPCGNPPAGLGRGCNNFGAGPSDSAELTQAGIPSIASDTCTLTATGENQTSTTIFLQSPSSSSTGVIFGAGIRCITGSLKRLYTGPASGGAITRPQSADPNIHTRSAALGDPLAAGSSRYYMSYYRDPQASGPCSNAVSTFNCSNSGKIVWAP